MSSTSLQKKIFYEVVETLEEKIAVSAYYTVELACQNLNKKPKELTQDDLPHLINAIVDIYKEYYPHRTSDVGNHLSMKLLQKDYEKKKKKRKRFFFF